MKTTIQRFSKGTLLALMAAFFVLAGTSLTSADPHHDQHEAWTHGNHGYWDNHSSYHNYTYYNHHHGYWRPDNNGVRVFINID